MKLPLPFRHLAWSNLMAQSAEQISLAAVPLVAVLALGAGPAETGLLAAAQTLPFLLLSLPAGLLADRHSRRLLLVLGETLRVLSLLVLIGLTASGLLSIAGLAVLGFLGATGTVVYSVAAPALLPSLVARQQLGLANGRLELARSVAYAGGPALAGALVAWSGASPAFVAAALLSGVAVWLLRRLPEQTLAVRAPRHPARELIDGAGFVWSHRLLRPILLTTVAWNLAWFVLQAGYVVYAVRHLSLNAGQVGATLAAYGMGMVAGALAAPRLIAVVRFGTALLIGPLVSVAASAGMAATLLAPPGLRAGLLAGLSLFLFGVGPIIWTITQMTLRQTVTPGAMLGRVSALFMTVSMGARPLGALLGGLVGALYGLPACILLAALGFVAQAVVILWSAVPALARLPAIDDTDAGRPAAAPA